MTPFVSLLGGMIVLVVLANLTVWTKWGWHWSTTPLWRNLCMILWRTIKEGSQLNAQRRRQPVVLGGSMHHCWHTPLDLPLKTSIMSTRVVEIWVIMGIREHPGKGYQLFFSQYWNTSPHTDPAMLKEISEPIWSDTHVRQGLMGKWVNAERLVWIDTILLWQRAVVRLFFTSQLFCSHSKIVCPSSLIILSIFNTLCPLPEILCLSFLYSV